MPNLADHLNRNVNVHRSLVVLALLALAILLRGNTVSAAEEIENHQWTVDGVNRVALVHVPASAQKRAAPVVFVFHGRGGQVQDAVTSFGIHRKWPEAIVVYMQAIPTVTPGDPEGKWTGWQRTLDNKQNRDLRFFDEVLRDMRQNLKVDEERVFVVGHSNGGGFAFLLWSQRGEHLAGVASCGMQAYPDMSAGFTPKPLLQIAGKHDPIQKLSEQEATVNMVRRLNECGEGEPWRRKGATIYPSKNGNPVAFFVHPGGHEVPKEAPALVVEFFKKEVGAKPASKPKNP